MPLVPIKKPRDLNKSFEFKAITITMATIMQLRNSQVELQVGLLTNLEFFLFISWFRNVFNYIVYNLSEPTNIALPSKSISKVVNAQVETPFLVMHMQVGYGGGLNFGK